MNKRIMVPLDGSAFSECALPWALAVADAWNADLELVNVREIAPEPDLGFWNDEAAAEWSETYLARAADRIEASDGRARPDTTVLTGAPSDALRDHAEESGADLVVMSTHGRGPLSRFWIGSVADSYVRGGPTPVLLVRPSEDDADEVDRTRPATIQRVLVALDGSEASEAVLPLVREVADAVGGRYDALRVFPYPGGFPSPYLSHTVAENADALEKGRESARTYAVRQAEHLKAAGAHAEAHVVVDRSPAAGILHQSEASGADMIVMATHGHGGVRRALVGSVADKVVRGSTLPVLVVRPEG
ncbi:MAG: universal stress protein [Longimicrobiales bacterium]